MASPMTKRGQPQDNADRKRPVREMARESLHVAKVKRQFIAAACCLANT